MSEKAKNPSTQNTIEDPPEYNAENGKNPKEGSDWLGGPQNGKTWEYPFKTASGGSDYAGNPNEQGNETPGKSTEATYQQNGQSALVPRETGEDFDGDSGRGLGYTKHRFSATSSGSDWLGGPQNGMETPGNGGNGGNSGSASGGGNGGNGGNG